MGMFDRFIVDLVCPDCGEHIIEIQSKKFDCMLNEYKIGDKISVPDVVIIEAIITEDAYCQCEEGLWDIGIIHNRFTYITKHND